MIKPDFMEKLLDGVEVEWKAIWEVTTWDKRFNSVERSKQPKIISYPYLLAADLFKLELKVMCFCYQLEKKMVGLQRS